MQSCSWDTHRGSGQGSRPQVLPTHWRRARRKDGQGCRAVIDIKSGWCACTLISAELTPQVDRRSRASLQISLNNTSRKNKSSQRLSPTTKSVSSVLDLWTGTLFLCVQLFLVHASMLTRFQCYFPLFDAVYYTAPSYSFASVADGCTQR